MTFDPNFDCERFFLMSLLRKIVGKQLFLTFVDSSKNFLSSCTNNEFELGFVTLTGFPGQAVVGISGYARS